VTSISPELVETITRIGSLANGVFFVGGVVRDEMLGGLRTFDLDLVVEADATEVVPRALPGKRLVIHKRFRTVTYRFDGRRVDVASARRERYERPGALPHVELADVEADLRRRDFTVNAMAVRLTGEPLLLDPVGGRRDLQRRVMRVLHEKSFVDDPTRLLRAVRYASRLGFEVEPKTMTLFRLAIGGINSLSGSRLRRELEALFREFDSGGAALEVLETEGALRVIHPGLSWDERRSGAISLDRSTYWTGAYPFLPRCFALLAANATPDDAGAVVERLRLRRDEAAAVQAIASLRGVEHTLRRPGAKPSGVVLLLDHYPPAAVAAYAATVEDQIAARLALRYLEEWRHVRPLLHGDDLIELGVPRGPQVTKGLQLVRAARLDGWASDEGDERALVQRFAKSIRDSSSGAVRTRLHGNGH
jgi:tRNA nucleotidyltransferase (CCA-adding enzyme)